MRLCDQIALTLPSFLLRIVLAIIFIWAGTAKIIGTTTTQGDSAARLANLGVTFIEPQSPPPSAEDPLTPPLPSEPINPLPETNPSDPTNNTPAIESPDHTQPAEPEPELSDPLPPPSTSTSPSTDDPQPDLPTPMANLPYPPYTLHQTSTNSSPAVGSDFPEPVTVKRVYMIALMLDYAVSPGLTPDSQPITPTMPSWIGSGSTPIYAAWAVAITELLAGFLLLIGLLTRISALSICTVMLVAIWMTQIGPAALQSNDALLGFIPLASDPWAPAAYQSLLWQLSLIAMSLSVFFLGAGPLSLDRAFFRPSRRDPYVSTVSTASTEPSRPQQQPKHHQEPPQKDRTAFDRSPPSLPDTPNPTP